VGGLGDPLGQGGKAVAMKLEEVFVMLIGDGVTEWDRFAVARRA